MAHPQTGFSSTWFLVELEFENVGFWGKGKTGVPGEKPLGAKERTNSTHIWRWRRDMNPGHIRELKMETFSGRRQLQPDVTSWFVQYCACSCSPHCRRAPVGDVKLVCLALWREREYLTFISIRFDAFCNQNFADYRSWIVLVVIFQARFPSSVI